MRTCLLSVLLLVVAIPSYAIHKCVVDGRTVYQQSPCASVDEAQDMTGRISVTPSDGGTRAQRYFGAQSPAEEAVSTQPRPGVKVDFVVPTHRISRN